TGRDGHIAADPGIGCDVSVYCETTSGTLNPVADIARVVATRGRRLLIDAMSAFGALPLDTTALGCDALMASSNKCLEGVPGIGFVVARRAALEACEGNPQPPSLARPDHGRYRDGSGRCASDGRRGGARPCARA